MCAGQPGQVSSPDPLVIAEEERISSVVVADVGPAAIDLERWDATLKTIWSIRAGDLQNIETEVRDDIKTFGAQSLTRIAKVSIEHNVRVECVSTTDAEN